MILLLFFVFLAIGTSFFCSIMEASVLSVQVSSLMEQKERGSRGAGRLLELKRERLDDLISAILTLNTIANTLGASMAGAEAAVLFGSHLLGVFSAVLTLLILVFAEIIPKTLGSLHASKLAPLIGHMGFFLVKLMRPILFLTRAITRLLTKDAKPMITSGELSAMITLAAAEGALDDYQREAVGNMLMLENIKIEDVMTPRTVVQMLSDKTSIAEFLKDAAAEPFSRIPIFGENEDDILGYIPVRHVLIEASRGCDQQIPLVNFMRPIDFLPRGYSVGNALTNLAKKKAQMAMVVDEFGGVMGLVTLEDLFETILGFEILDEFDRYADMQVIAKQLRDKRHARIKKRESIAKS